MEVGKEERIDSKTVKKNFLGVMERRFHILTVIVKMHQTVHIKWVHFLYMNYKTSIKQVLRKINVYSLIYLINTPDS